MYLLGGKTSSAGLDDPQVDVSEASTEEMSEGNFSLNFSFHTFVNWYNRHLELCILDLRVSFFA